jgi:type IV secretion system protein VirB9
VYQSTAFAYQIPTPAKGDARVRNVIYDPANVVRIHGSVGLQTFILFADGETITDIGSGDTDAWAIGIIQQKNGFFVKPKGPQATTNLAVITDRRHYNFDLIQDAEKAFYMVRFSYPDDQRAKELAAADKALIAGLLDADGKRLNYDYWWDGSLALRPIGAWDNGTFTFLRFPPGREFPAVFMMNEEDPKIESTINMHVVDDTLILHKIAHRFVLRLGNKATGLWNKGYSPIVGVDLPGNTVSPMVTREVR